jgi:ABC-type sugar transport system, periplasmic component
MIMKKTLSILMCTLLVGSMLVGCGKKDTSQTAASAKSEKTFTVGASFFSLTTEYPAKLKDKILQYAKEKYGDNIKFVVLDGKGDSDTQNSGVDNLIAQKVDAIILVPFDAQQQIPAVQAAVDAKIPLLEVCLQTADKGLRTSFVGSDDTKSGVFEMEYLAKQMGGKGNVVYLHGPTGQDSEIKRHEGADQVLAKNPGIKKVAEKVCNWNRAEAMNAVENLLQSGMQIDGIFAENDEMALGAYAAIEGTDKKDKIKIGGIDCISDALKAVKDGKLACTVFQDAYGQAQQVVDATYNTLNGKTVEKYYEVPYQLVTKDNVDDPYLTK